MQSQRVIQLGHLLASVFIALLLVGGRGFLSSHPVVAGLLLAAFAPVYYFAARITRYRQFLYPAVLLLVLAYHLVLHGAGVALADQPLLALLPLAAVYFAARNGWPRAVRDASLSLFGAINLLIGVYAAWILFRAPWFYLQAPLATTLALAGYSLYVWLRFRVTDRALYAVAAVVLLSGGFFYFLYAHSHLALILGSVAVMRLLSELRDRGVLRRLPTFVLGLTVAFLLLVGTSGTRVAQLPLGYLLLASFWLLLGLALYTPSEKPLVGPQTVLLPRLLPLFAGGLVLGLLPIGVFYPWKPLIVTLAYLTVFFVVFLAIGRELAKNTLGLIGVALTRVLAGLGRLAPVVAFVVLAFERFPASYDASLACLSIGLLSLLAGWRQLPRVLERRNIYVYQAGVFLTLAYFLAEQRLAPIGVVGTLLDSGALPVLVLLAAAWLLRERLPQPYLRSLYDSASILAATACGLALVRGPIAWRPALALGGLLLAASSLMFIKVRERLVLFIWPVVLGYWLYVAEWLAGTRGEMLGTPYLIWGIASAAVGYELLRRKNPWHELFYFMWSLCVVVSLTLFYPYRDLGAYGAPLWPIVLLFVARGTASRADFPLVLVLEMLSGALAVASVGVLVSNGLYLAAAVALFLYALAYAWVAVRRRLWLYLYPASAACVSAYFLGIYSGLGAKLFLAYFLPEAVVLYTLAACLRRRGWSAQAFPLDLATSAAVAAGALRFVTLPFSVLRLEGVLTGLAYLALYFLLTRLTPERVFLAGAGLAGAFTVFELLPFANFVTGANRLGYFIPVALVLAVLGRRQHRVADRRGGWGLYAAAIATTALASFFALWPAPASPTASRVVLMIATAVWLALLLWTRHEIFVYCGTLALAMLAFNFVQSSADLFGQHLVAFFLAGTLALGLIFLAAAARNFVRLRRPALFVPPERAYQRLLYLFPVTLLALATFASWGVSTSSNPYFCGTCHNMNVYFATWKSSAHARANVGCDACHYEPGMRGYVKAKLQGTSELVATLTGREALKPMAAVSNQTCLASQCHSTSQLAGEIHPQGRFYFNHASHLGPLSRGPELRCTSCHGDVGPETHFAVDTNACFTCHFRAASSPAPVSAVGCVGCHRVPTGARGASGFDHVASGVQGSDESCLGCHAGLTRGSAAVEARQCRHCHVQRPAELLARGSAFVHRKHVTERGVACDWCHGAVEHKPAVDSARVD